MKLLCLVLTILTFLVGSAKAEAAPFKYTPFPPLPSTTVTADRFVSELTEACELLVDTAGKLNAPALCTPAPFVMPLPNAYGAVLSSARQLPREADATAPGASKDLQSLIADSKKKAPLKSCNPAFDAAQAGAKQLESAAQQLQAVCAKLYRAAPQPLTPPDVQVLKAARDTPGLLAALSTWAKAIKDGAAGPDTMQEALAGTQGIGAGGALLGAGSLGSLGDQFIRGTAEFLKTRAQAEALRYLRERLKKDLCEGKGDDAALRRELFSNVCAALGSLEKGMSLEAIGSYLRAAAEKDLKKLPDLGLAYLEHSQPALANATFAGRLSLAYYATTRTGRDAFEVLYSLAELPVQPCEAATTCKEVGRAVRLASVVGYALRQGNSEWQSQFDPSGLTPERAPVMGVAILLLAEKRAQAVDTLVAPGGGAGAIALNLNDGVLLTKLITKPLAITTDALSMLKTWQALEGRLSGNVTEEERRELLADAIEQEVGTFTHLVEQVDSLLNPVPTKAVTEATQHAREFAGVAANLVRRNYGAVAVATLARLQEMTPGAAQPPAWAGKYLPLVVEIATAQSSNDVAAAIDAAAAPLGSYELKFEQPMLTLNGVFGWTYGMEHMDSKGVKGTSAATAAFAPIGVHLSFPIERAVHLGALFTAFDLGAVTAFKTTDEQPEGKLESGDSTAASGTPEASDSPQIRFEQVFSPGAYFVIGFCKTPIVLGVGAAMAPRLREVRQDSLVEDVTVLRYGVFAGIDVPILPFSFK